MNHLNPYQPPGTSGDVAHSELLDRRLAEKSRRLLERYDEPISSMKLLASHWRRHVVIAVCLGVLCLLSWQSGNTYLVIGLGAFWAGRMTRDIQWYRTIALEWESTKELLDWEKIKRLAG